MVRKVELRMGKIMLRRKEVTSLVLRTVAPVNRAVRRARCELLAEGERHCRTDDEHEQRHDQIVAGESDPVSVFQLPLQPLRGHLRLDHGRCQRDEQGLAAHDPKHVKATQRINADDAACGGGWSE